MAVKAAEYLKSVGHIGDTGAPKMTSHCGIRSMALSCASIFVCSFRLDARALSPIGAFHVAPIRFIGVEIKARRREEKRVNRDILEST